MDVQISYEQHVQQNNERLVSIKEQIGDVRGYERGCRELISWCSDQRAFQTAFEENLLNVLCEVVNVSSRDDFDSDLAFSLISCCHLHRKLLSRAGSIKLNRWYEQMKRHKRALTGGGTGRKGRTSNAKKANVQPVSDPYTGNLQVETNSTTTPANGITQ